MVEGSGAIVVESRVRIGAIATGVPDTEEGLAGSLFGAPLRGMVWVFAC